MRGSEHVKVLFLETWQVQDNIHRKVPATGCFRSQKGTECANASLYGCIRKMD